MTISKEEFFKILLINNLNKCRKGSKDYKEVESLIEPLMNYSDWQLQDVINGDKNEKLLSGSLISESGIEYSLVIRPVLHTFNIDKIDSANEIPFYLLICKGFKSLVDSRITLQDILQLKIQKPILLAFLDNCCKFIKTMKNIEKKDTVIEESLEEFVNKYTPTLTNCWEFSKELVDNWNKENEIDGDRRLKLTSPESVKELESIFLKYFPKEIVDIEMRIKPDTEIFPVCACLESLILLRDIRNPDKQTIIRNYNDRNQPVIYLEKGDGQLNGEIFYGNNTDLYNDEFLPDLKDEKYILNVHNDDYEVDVFGCEVDVPTLVNVFKISKEKIAELFQATMKAKFSNNDIIEESIETNTPLDRTLNELLLKAYDFDKKELKKLGIEEAIKQLKTVKWTAKKSTFDAYQYKQLETNININDYNFTFYIRETEPWGDEKTISDLRFNIGFRYYKYVVSTEIELKSIMQLNINQNEMKSFISDCAKCLKVQQKKYAENIAWNQRMGWEADNNVIEESVGSFDINKRYEEIVNPECLTEEKIRDLEKTESNEDMEYYWYELENNIPERKRIINEIRNGETDVSVLGETIYVEFKDKEQMHLVPSDYEISFGEWSISFQYMYNLFTKRYSTKDLIYVFGIKPEIISKSLSNIKRLIRTNNRLEVVEESVMNEEYYKKVSNLDIINRLYRHTLQRISKECKKEENYLKLKDKFTENFKNVATDGKWYVDYRSFNNKGLPKPYLRHNYGGYPYYRFTIECVDLRMPISEYVIQFCDRYGLIASNEIKVNEMVRLNIPEDTLQEFYTNLYKYFEEIEKVIRDAERTNYGKGEVIEESEEFPMNRDNELIWSHLRDNIAYFDESEERFKNTAYDFVEAMRNSDDIYVGIVNRDTGEPCEDDLWDADAAIVVKFKYRNRDMKAIIAYNSSYLCFSYTFFPEVSGFLGMNNINASMLERIYNIPAEFVKDCIKLESSTKRAKYFKDYDKNKKALNQTIEEAEELPSLEDIAKEVEEWDETKEEEALLNKVGELLPTIQYRLGKYDVAEKCRAILTMLEIPEKWEIMYRNSGDHYLVYPISGSILVDFELTFDAGAIDAVTKEAYIPYTLSLLDMRGYRTNLMEFTFSELLSELHLPLELARKLHEGNLKYSAMFRKHLDAKDYKDVIEESMDNNYDLSRQLAVGTKSIKKEDIPDFVRPKLLELYPNIDERKIDIVLNDIKDGIKRAYVNTKKDAIYWILNKVRFIDSLEENGNWEFDERETKLVDNKQYVAIRKNCCSSLPLTLTSYLQGWSIGISYKDAVEVLNVPKELVEELSNGITKNELYGMHSWNCNIEKNVIEESAEYNPLVKRLLRKATGKNVEENIKILNPILKDIYSDIDPRKIDVVLRDVEERDFESIKTFISTILFKINIIKRINSLENVEYDASENNFIDHNQNIRIIPSYFRIRLPICINCYKYGSCIHITADDLVSVFGFPKQYIHQLSEIAGKERLNSEVENYLRYSDNNVIEESIEDNKKYVDYVLTHNVIYGYDSQFEPGEKEAEANRIGNIIKCFAKASKKEMGWLTTDGDEINHFTHSDDKVYLLKIYSSEYDKYTFNVYFSPIRKIFVSNLGIQKFCFFEMSAGDLKRLVDITDEEIYKLMEENKNSPQTLYFQGIRQRRKEDEKEHEVIEESIDGNILLKRYSEITNPDQVSVSQMNTEMTDEEYYELQAELNDVKAREDQVEQIKIGNKVITTRGKSVYSDKPCIQVEFKEGDPDIGRYAYFVFNGYNWDLDITECQYGNFYDSFTTQDLIQIFNIPEDLIKQYLELYKSLNIPFPMNKNKNGIIEESIELNKPTLQELKDKLKINKNVKIKEKHIELFSDLCKKYFSNEKIVDLIVNIASNKIGDVVNINYFVNLIEYIETLSMIAKHKLEKVENPDEYGDVYIELGDVGAKIYRSSSKTDELFIRAGSYGINSNIKDIVEIFNVKPKNVEKLIKLTPEYNISYNQRKQKESEKEIIEESLEITNVSLYRKIRKLTKDKPATKENFELMKEAILANSDFNPKIVDWAVDYIWQRASKEINYVQRNIEAYDVEYVIQLIEIFTMAMNHKEEKAKDGTVFIDDIQISVNAYDDDSKIWIYYYPYHLSTSLPTNCITLFNLKPESLQELFGNKELYKKRKTDNEVEE